MTMQLPFSSDDQKAEEMVPSMHEWAQVFQLAIAFKQLRCWEWMSDGDLFGVQDPDTGEIGYCCVMGQLGEVFALNVYPGLKGVASYQYLQRLAEDGLSGDLLGPQAMLMTQDCVMVSFEDRSELHQKDLQLIRSLGLKFRGKREWPMFRNYKPGHVPWFLTASDVRLLTGVLSQAIEVATCVRENPLFLAPPETTDDRILVRTYQEGIWMDAWHPLPDYVSPTVVPIMNDLRLAQLKKSDFPRRGIWATDCVLLPMPIHEGRRPYYPFGFPVFNEEGISLGFEKLHPDEIESQVPEVFMQLLEHSQIVPQMLQVGSERTLALLKPIAKKLNFSIQQVESLPVLDFFLQGMEDFLGS